MEDNTVETATAKNNEKKVSPLREAYVAVLEQIRTRSHQGLLTSLELASSLCPQIKGKETLMIVITTDENCPDIKQVVAADGVQYFYSEDSLAQKDTRKLVFDEEVMTRVALQVRVESVQQRRLTAISTLGSLIPGAENDKVDRIVVTLLSDEGHRDIRSVTNSKGIRYLYSAEGMTSGYAEVLARAEANDPVASIAATVRDDSRTYPYPTNVGVFAAPVFKINADRIEEYITEILRQPQYSDIGKIRASTGATYLYSSLYVNADWARATVEWAEVGQYQNP